MKYRDPIVTLLLAFFVPFYVFYWWYDTGKAMKARGAPGVPAFWPLIVTYSIYMVTVLGMVVGIVINGIKSGANGDPSVSASLPGFIYIPYLLVPIVWVVMGVYTYRFSKAATTLVPFDLSAGILTLVFILCGPLGVYLVQEKLNLLVAQDYAQQNPSYGQPAPPSV